MIGNRLPCRETRIPATALGGDDDTAFRIGSEIDVDLPEDTKKHVLYCTRSQGPPPSSLFRLGAGTMQTVVAVASRSVEIEMTRFFWYAMPLRQWMRYHDKLANVGRISGRNDKTMGA